MIYIITKDNEIVFATHSNERIEEKITSICNDVVGLPPNRLDEKIKILKEFNYNYYTIIPNLEEE